MRVMNKGPLGKILICVVSFSAALCAYLHARNDVTKLMIQLPKLSHDLSLIEEQNTILKYEIERFENPSYLLGLLKTVEYAHLHMDSDVKTIAIKSEAKGLDKKVETAKGYSGKAILGTSVR